MNIRKIILSVGLWSIFPSASMQGIEFNSSLTTIKNIADTTTSVIVCGATIAACIATYKYLTFVPPMQLDKVDFNALLRTDVLPEIFENADPAVYDFTYETYENSKFLEKIIQKVCEFEFSFTRQKLQKFYDLTAQTFASDRYINTIDNFNSIFLQTSYPYKYFATLQDLEIALKRELLYQAKDQDKRDQILQLFKKPETKLQQTVQQIQGSTKKIRSFLEKLKNIFR